MAARLANITFDCADPLKVSAFWSAVLDRPADPDGSEYFCSIGLSDPDSAPNVFFAAVEEAKTVKNRQHVDLETDDVPAEIARLVALGATHVVDRDEWGHAWSVLTDVEGNEFCISGTHVAS